MNKLKSFWLIISLIACPALQAMLIKQGKQLTCTRDIIHKARDLARIARLGRQYLSSDKKLAQPHEFHQIGALVLSATSAALSAFSAGFILGSEPSYHYQQRDTAPFDII